MKRIFILVVVVCVAGCGCSSKSTSGPGTSLLGTWTVNGSLASQGGPHTYTVVLVSSPCSVTAPVGTFSLQGPVCFIADNNSTQGSISGGGVAASLGVLVGVAANPVPANGTVNLLFVVAGPNGTFIEFTGVGTIVDGTITGTGACSSTTPMCQGMSVTFTATQQ